MRNHRVPMMVLSAAAGAILFTTGASAQDFDDDDDDDEGQAALEFRAGVAIPGSDLETYFDPGFSAGVGYVFPLASRVNLAFQGDVAFLSDIEEDEEIGTGEVEQFFESQMRLWHYGADLQFELTDAASSSVAVVLHGSLGATTIDPEQTVIIEGGADPVFTDAETRTRFTANGGLSLGVALSDNIDLLVDGKAYSIFIDDDDFEVEDTLEDQIGETWWSFPISAMLRLHTN